MARRNITYLRQRSQNAVRRQPRTNLNIPRSTRRKPGYGRTGNLDEERKTAILVVKIAVSAIIIVVVMLLKSIDTPATQWAVDKVRDAITYDFSINETLGKLKFVSDYLPGFKAVFGEQNMTDTTDSVTQGMADSTTQGMDDYAQQPVFTAPAEGKVVSYFGQPAEDGKSGNNTGIDIVSQQQGWVYSVGDGQVIATGEDQDWGKYVKVDQGDGLICFYARCSEIQAKVGVSLKQGDRIGKMGDDSSGAYRLHFEIRKDEQPLDPLPFIQEGSKVLQ